MHEQLICFAVDNYLYSSRYEHPACILMKHAYLYANQRSLLAGEEFFSVIEDSLKGFSTVKTR